MVSFKGKRRLPNQHSIVTTCRAMIGLSLAALAALSGCDKPENIAFIWQQPYHAKLKVEVDTPQGVKTGFSVIEVKWAKSNRSFHVRGEAVAVDLPGGQTLFALLRSASSVDWAAYLHYNVKLDGPINSHEELYRRVAANRTVWPVARRNKTAVEDSDNYPYFIRFKDAADPKSVEQVDPEDLAKSFGPGVKLKSLTVQMTDEPVTVGIEKRFSWWNYYRNRHFDGTSTVTEDLTNPIIAARLSSGSFSTEFNK
jgi:hypothetical protein